MVEYDPSWPRRFAREAAAIRAALGGRALLVEHIGSTSVPGLVAKPIVDVLLVVRDSADEPAWLPDLEAAGYVLRVREPDWHEHRMLRTPTKDVHLHVYSPDSPEIARNLAFRDRLRTDAVDRALYADTKRRRPPGLAHDAALRRGQDRGDRSHLRPRCRGEPGVTAPGAPGERAPRPTPTG